MDSAVITSKNNDNGTLTIAIKGRVNSENASDIEKNIEDILAKNQHTFLEIDANDLTYISSAGLRVLMKIRKAEEYKIINVSTSIYEVFQMTGFTKIIDIHHAFREISVEGCKLLGQGLNGEVYRLDPETIVKVYKPQALLSDIERERNFAQAAFLHSVPTAISYDVVKCNNGCLGIVFELINADTFNHKFCDDPDNFEKYALQYSQTLKLIHSSEVEEGVLPKTKDLYQNWAEEMSIYLKKEEVDLLHQFIDNIPDRNTIIHGDYHPRNIMTQNEELVLIDMADVSCGHPIFDLAGMGLTHVFYPSTTPQNTKHFLGVSTEDIQRLWKLFLAEYFQTKDIAKIEARQAEIMPYTYLRYCLNPAIIKHLDDEKISNSIIVARERLFPTIKKQIGRLSF